MEVLCIWFIQNRRAANFALKRDVISTVTDWHRLCFMSCRFLCCCWKYWRLPGPHWISRHAEDQGSTGGYVGQLRFTSRCSLDFRFRDALESFRVWPWSKGGVCSEYLITFLKRKAAKSIRKYPKVIDSYVYNFAALWVSIQMYVRS